MPTTGAERRRAATWPPPLDQPPVRTTLAQLVAGVRRRDRRALLAAEQRRTAGDRMGALRAYARLVDRSPQCWPARLHFGLLCHLGCDHDTALAELRAVLTRWPGLAEAWYNYGTILQCVGAYSESVDALARALALDPDADAARVNLGNAWLGLGQPERAIPYYHEAIARRPTHPDARWNLSHALLLLGQWREGWQAYEARWQIPGFVEGGQIQVPADHPVRPWTGTESLRLQRLLVVEEQGYGDTMMCFRYAPVLRARGAVTSWAVRPELVRLAEAATGGDRVLSIRESIPRDVDLAVSCMSLHARCATTPDTVPPPPPVRGVARAPRRPGPLRVGLAWQGSRAHRNDRIRSLPRGALAPLAALPGIEWACLSPEAWEPRLAETGLVPLLDGVADWYDTARRIAHLDLVVSVDTAIAHLAAGLGIPTWILLSAVPDARWGLTEATTPWYPAARLVRQPRAGDWASVIEAVAHALRTELPR